MTTAEGWQPAHRDELARQVYVLTHADEIRRARQLREYYPEKYSSLNREQEALIPVEAPPLASRFTYLRRGLHVIRQLRHHDQPEVVIGIG